MLVTVKNKLPGLLNLGPLKDASGAVLVLKGNQSCEVHEDDLENPIIRQVITAKWLEVLRAPSVVSEPRQEPAPEPAVIKISAPPEELAMPIFPEDAVRDEAMSKEPAVEDESQAE